MQSRMSSFTESCLNTASGFVISFAAGFVVFPMFGFPTSITTNLSLTAIYTVISVVRSYVWRRIFNNRQKSKFDLVAHLERQREFSLTTFGPGARTEGVTDHISKELNEIRAKPDDLEEWIDVIILGFDGAWRTGATSEQIVAALVAKQTKNEGRQWPDWRTADPDKAVEHVRIGVDYAAPGEDKALEVSLIGHADYTNDFIEGVTIERAYESEVIKKLHELGMGIPPRPTVKIPFVADASGRYFVALDSSRNHDADDFADRIA